MNLFDKIPFMQDEKQRSLVFFATSAIALIILLFIPCPNLFVVLLQLIALILTIVNGASFVFLSGILGNMISDENSSLATKKSSKVDITKYRSFFVNVGFIVTLLVLLLSFNWKNCVLSGSTLVGDLAIPDELEVDIPPSKQEKPPPPPPPPPKLEIVEDEEILEDEPEIEDVEMDEETEIEVVDEVSTEEEIFTVVEDMPVFPGGEAALLKYLQGVGYPQIAFENDIQGRVFVEFVIDKTGKTTNIKVVRGVHPSLDNAAINRIKNMPRWSPAKQRGRPVKLRMTLPFVFKLAN